MGTPLARAVVTPYYTLPGVLVAMYFHNATRQENPPGMPRLCDVVHAPDQATTTTIPAPFPLLRCIGDHSSTPAPPHSPLGRSRILEKNATTQRARGPISTTCGATRALTAPQVPFSRISGSCVVCPRPPSRPREGRDHPIWRRTARRPPRTSEPILDSEPRHLYRRRSAGPRRAARDKPVVCPSSTPVGGVP